MSIFKMTRSPKVGLLVRCKNEGSNTNARPASQCRFSPDTSIQALSPTFPLPTLPLLTSEEGPGAPDFVLSAPFAVVVAGLPAFPAGPPLSPTPGSLPCALFGPPAVEPPPPPNPTPCSRPPRRRGEG